MKADFFRSLDWPLIISALCLMAIGLSAIYSVDLAQDQNLLYLKKQLLAVAVGIVVMFVLSQTPTSLFVGSTKALYGVSLVLLILVLFLGADIRGSHGWFSLGSISFQPLELAKVSLILMLAYITDHFGRHFERPLYIVGTGAVTLLFIIPIMLEPNLGSAVLLAIIWFGIMVLAGARRRYLFYLAILTVIVGTIGWLFILKPYQKDRILTFVDPTRDVLGTGYNVNQAIIAVGGGQLFGKGLGYGSQSQLDFLPEAHTDFIFSVIGEELGFVGVVLLLTLYAILFWRLWLIIKKGDNDFAAVAGAGILLLFLSQFFVNVGSNIGLLPVTGVTLPLVSYGGSSLVLNLAILGIALSIHRENIRHYR